MIRLRIAGILSNKFREHTAIFFCGERKIILKFIFTLLFFAVGIWLIKHEKA